MRLLTTLVVMLLVSAFFGIPAHAQSDWEVEGELTLEDLGDPGTESDTNNLQNEPKIQSYEPLLEIDSGASHIGFGTVDYYKDADPSGEFVLTITATSVGLLDVTFFLGHETIDVSFGSLEMVSYLSVELIDLGGGGVVLTASGAMLAPGVREEEGLGTTDVPLPSVALAIDEVLNGEGVTEFNSGIVNYTRNNKTVAMFLGGRFQLTAGDQAILRGRFEIGSDIVPVENKTWSDVKALYSD